ncbi:phosphopantetheine attachment domain protein [Babesia caballi]|uniref:Phosphopantetheine attachment domain protein n=1 Tax=Babesia caballi TaxID=5871 RepID=A0AAV4LUF7_BABCB|nr:phosphopantetheine attachment domain protein [Babesia caballi]
MCSRAFLHLVARLVVLVRRVAGSWAGSRPARRQPELPAADQLNHRPPQVVQVVAEALEVQRHVRRVPAGRVHRVVPVEADADVVDGVVGVDGRVAHRKEELQVGHVAPLAPRHEAPVAAGLHDIRLLELQHVSQEVGLDVGDVAALPRHRRELIAQLLGERCHRSTAKRRPAAKVPPASIPSAGASLGQTSQSSCRQTPNRANSQ